MEGLDCIAMAVAHLEREEEEQRSEDSCSMGSSKGLQGTPIPQRSGFENTPRRVSSDSMYEEEAASTTPVSHSPTPSQETFAVAEGSSPEEITRLVDSLSDDGKFQSPPPAPPAPTEVITDVMDCDVLCGRGGETNHHSGNVKYRALVKKYQPLYIASKRRDKPRIAEKIVRTVRHLGGRFLRKDRSNTWRDVGNTKAREKTSQALREGAPDLRTSSSNTKEETQQTPSSPSQSLGNRKFQDYAGSQSKSVLDPSWVEMQSREVDRVNVAYDSPLKKLKVGDAAGTLHGLSQFFGGATQGLGRGLPPSAYVSPRLLPQESNLHPQLVSPNSFAVTISADDHDQGAVPEIQKASKSMPRGPRLKLLKKRLQAEESGV